MAFAISGTTALAIAAGAAGVSAISSGIQAYNANQNRMDASGALEAAARNSPLYKPNKTIQEYYQSALNRYNENPYQSQQYKLGAMNAQRATAQGLGALQDRRSAIGGISRLEAGQNAALQNLGAQAEAQRNARFGQLGGAAQMKAGEEYKAFDINKLTPYNRDLQLKQMKLQAANEEYAQNVSNVYNSLGNLASVGMSAYGGGKGMGGAGSLAKQYNANNANIKSMLQTVPMVPE
jgi:hypothetical protein